MGLVPHATSYPSMKWFESCMTPSDIVYIGLRDVDAAEKKFIKDLGIKAYTVSSSREMPSINCPMISTKSS